MASTSWCPSPRSASTMPTGWSRSPAPAWPPGNRSWSRRYDHGHRRTATTGGFDDIAALGNGGSRPVLEVDQVTKIYPSEPPVTALRGVTFTVDRGELVGDRRPIGVGQDHPAAPDGHPGPAQLGRRAGHRPRRRPALGPRAGRPAGDPDRLRVPAVLPGRARKACWTTWPTACSTPGSPSANGAPRRPRRPGSGGAGRRTAGPAHPAVGRATSTGRHRPSPDRPARPSCWPTNRPATWTRPPASPSWPSSTSCTGRGRPSWSSPMTVTSPARMPRRIEMLDGADRLRQRARHVIAFAELVSPGQTGASQHARPGDAFAAQASSLGSRLAGQCGLRSRKLRAGLSALGIAIGVAAIVAVLGLSSSSQAGLLNEIDAVGHKPADGYTTGKTSPARPPSCPHAAPEMIGRIGPGDPSRTTPGRSTVSTPTAVNYVNPLSHQRPHGRRGQPGPTPHRGHHRGPRPLPRTRPPPKNQYACWVGRRPATGSRPHLR